ncbi:MAG: RNA polymerase sigma factor [Bacteroidetes bacterium]|nr:RNA polymerase sigma factor [Bacteroidota bacterium]MDA0943498.1 RNA polymerase sigma factor [Bacteroidota bacterium]MDA1112121.1 RNA polymerase sigma factor [Bacteroidota bacterium]
MQISEYNRVVETIGPALYRFALKNLNDPDQAQEIVQVSIEHVRAWCFRVASHAIVDWHRQRSRFQELSSSTEPLVEPAHFDAGLKHLLHLALNQLSVPQKLAVTLRDLEGYSYAEIADITGQNKAQVKINLFRGRQKLRELLSSFNPNPS